MNADNGIQQYIPQFREKIGWKLFPSNHIDSPRLDNAHDCLHCHVVASFSFLDRLRILISGEVKVTVKTATENLLGAHETATGVEVLPPKYLRRSDSN